MEVEITDRIEDIAEEKINQIEFWQKILEKDREEIKMIDAEIRINLGNKEGYKLPLNLIGRDLMLASTKGINVKLIYLDLNELRDRYY